MDYLVAVILAFVEGVTEFLPVSSTGHLILVEDRLRLGDDPAFADSFLVIIQLPAILAVVLYFWRDLWPFSKGTLNLESIRLWALTFVAFLPAAFAGLLFGDLVDDYLFNPLTVALALIVGGVVLVLVERGKHKSTLATVHEIGFRTAFYIGLFQCLALVPGTSRSAATIIGAILLGASRAAAAEFSFFLAVPTMVAATGYTLLKSGLGYTAHQWGLVALGSLVSFLVAYSVVAFLMRFIRKHSFAPFGYYRIVLGLLVLAALLG